MFEQMVVLSKWVTAMIKTQSPTSVFSVVSR